MYCRACGAANPEGARFCGDCGATLKTEPAGAALIRPVPRAVGPSSWRPCPRCGAQMVVPYFHRPMNLLKLFVATCMWFAPAVLFVLIRKDRLVCRACGTMRGQEGELAALQSLQVERIQPAADNALTLAPRDPEADSALTLARKKERSAMTLAVVTVGCAALAATGSGFVIPAAICGGGALLQFFRSRSLRRTGDARRTRHEALRILELAAVRKGRLTVTEVAAALQMNLQEAERALDRMVDGQRVDLDVDDEGHVSYVFPELAR